MVLQQSENHPKSLIPRLECSKLKVLRFPKMDFRLAFRCQRMLTALWIHEHLSTQNVNLNHESLVSVWHVDEDAEK